MMYVGLWRCEDLDNYAENAFILIEINTYITPYFAWGLKGQLIKAVVSSGWGRGLFFYLLPQPP